MVELFLSTFRILFVIHLVFGINTRLAITIYHDNHSHHGIQFSLEQCQHVASVGEWLRCMTHDQRLWVQILAAAGPR